MLGCSRPHAVPRRWPGSSENQALEELALKVRQYERFGILLHSPLHTLSCFLRSVLGYPNDYNFLSFSPRGGSEGGIRIPPPPPLIRPVGILLHAENKILAQTGLFKKKKRSLHFASHLRPDILNKAFPGGTLWWYPRLYSQSCFVFLNSLSKNFWSTPVPRI